MEDTHAKRQQAIDMAKQNEVRLFKGLGAIVVAYLTLVGLFGFITLI